MRKFGLLLALVATLSLTFLQIAPSFASEHADRGRLLDLARRGDIAIVTSAQMQLLAQSNPRLHAKLQAAYQLQTPPQLTAAEKAVVHRLTRTNVRQIKAGQVQVVVNKPSPPAATTPDLSAVMTACVTAGSAVLGFLGPFAPVVATLGCLLIIPLVGAVLGIQAVSPKS
ncbi:MAG TPA: hypothetical protein VFA57_15980 [Pseudolabrys sp.]|nr:hypothetical protein [Pseudolabrys sp.]